ncbi:hypothetical protein WDW89_15020 [Deltaproteobacteria bacterium TL4]
MRAIVNKKNQRPSLEWIERFKSIPPSIASDCLNRYYAMHSTISPVFENCALCGFAMTIQSMSGNNLMSHLALTFAEPGDVLVVDARGNLGQAVWGGVQTAYAQKQGVAGIVIDGAIRDVAYMREHHFPAYCKGVIPAGPHKGWADSVNVPIQCGGVPVMPGDLILGDDDGVVVVPQNLLESVFKEAQKRLQQEREWFQKIEEGSSSLDVVGLCSVLSQMDIEYLE